MKIPARSDWYNLYGDNWRDTISRDALKHPAKFNPGLISHIYRHIIEEGWVVEGDFVIDPFAGVSLGALDAMKNGLNWVGVELEPNFSTIGFANIIEWENQYGKVMRSWGKPWGSASVLQGDSRNLANILKERAVDSSISSPPYSSNGLGHAGKPSETDIQKGLFSRMAGNEYGQTEGNLGNLPDNPEGFNAAISSPPFIQTSGGTNVTSKEGPLSDPSLLRRHSAGNAATNAYGESDGQLSSMKDNGFVAAITSPPYADIAQNGGTEGIKRHGTGLTGGEAAFAEYGDEAGQLGRMKNTDGGYASAVVSSPPYAEARIGQQSGQEQCGHNDAYGETEGQLGGMKDRGFDASVTSPPYADVPVAKNHMTSIARLDPNNPNYRPSWVDKFAEGFNDTEHDYGETDGQMSNMRSSEEGFDASVSSPPFESVLANRPSQQLLDSVNSKQLNAFGAAQYGDGYGESTTEGNIGDTSGDDFWIAARQIIDNVYAVLRPGGHAIWVCKKYVKNKRLVHFDRMWAKVCVAAGFEVCHWHRAWVLEDKGTQYTLDGNVDRRIIKRASFFRRLAEKKGSPRIDWETVICTRKPA